MKFGKAYLPLALSATLLAGCGGDPASMVRSFVLSGFVAKGAVAGAVVKAHPVSNGKVDTGTTLAEGLTKADGSYELSFASAPTTDYVVVVQSRDGTTMKDEVSGNNALRLPASFALRAIPPAVREGKATLNITPFSELSVAAAEKKQFQLTATAQAVQNMGQLLGFDPRFVTPRTLAEKPADLNEQKLAVLLTAISKMANDASLAQTLQCTAADLGARTDCVVDKLAAASTIDSIVPGTQGADTLGQAITDVLAGSLNDGLVSPSTLDTITSNLENPPAPAPVVPATTVSAIDSALQMFEDIRTTLITLFNPESRTVPGGVTTEAVNFRTALRDVEAPVEVLVRDASSLVTAADLYHDYKQGRTSSTTYFKGYDTVEGNSSQVNNHYGIACTLYKDETGSTELVPGDSGALIQSVWCSSIYFVQYTYTYTGYPYYSYKVDRAQYRHRFKLLTNNAGNSFSYSSRVDKREYINSTCTSNCPTIRWTPLQYKADGVTPADEHTGTFNVQLDTDKNVTGFSIANGALPPMFIAGTSALYNPGSTDRAIWNLSGTLSKSGTREIAEVQGDIAIHKGDKLDSTLVVKPGSKLVEDLIKAGSTQTDLVEVALLSSWAGPTAKAEGSFSMGSPVWDKSGSNRVPSTVAFEGSLYNKVNGAWFEFLQGKVTAGVSGYGNYDKTKPDSLTNDYAVSLKVEGRATAPNRPRTDIVLSTSGSAFKYDNGIGTLTGQYRTLDSQGTVRRVMSFDGSFNGTSDTVSVLETTSGVSFKLYGNTALSDVTKDGAVIGQVDRDRNKVTFKDGRFISLEF